MRGGCIRRLVTQSERYFQIDIAHLVLSVSGHEFADSFMSNSTYTLIYPTLKRRKACRVKAIEITLFYH